MNKRLLRFGLGVVAGAVGGKILQSNVAKNLAVSTVAGGLKVKEGIDKTVENIKLHTEDIVAEAKIKKAEDEKAEAERKAKLDIEEVAKEAETEEVEVEVEEVE